MSHSKGFTNPSKLAFYGTIAGILIGLTIVIFGVAGILIWQWRKKKAARILTKEEEEIKGKYALLDTDAKEEEEDDDV